MAQTPRNHVSDLRGASRLAIDATAGLTALVEAMHHTISKVPGVLGSPTRGRTGGITGLVYGSVRGATRLVGGAIDIVLRELAPMLGEQSSSPGREAVIAALNGVLGDYLAATENPLAVTIQFRRDGRPLELDRHALAEALPQASGKILVLAHGLCMNDLQWTRNGHDHGAALARDLGYMPVYLHYNTGLHISTNGRLFSEQLEGLIEQWPVAVEEFVIVGHSMGGLLARSAHHYGMASGCRWPKRLDKLVFLGTPHQGSPLERGGNHVDMVLGLSPYTAPFTRLGKIRSAGITDLRHGSLLDEDWDGRDRFARSRDHHRPLPLPEGVRCYAIAATTARKSEPLKARLLGDGLVPLASALGKHADPAFALAFPESRQWIGYGMNHLELLDRQDVYEQVRKWLA